MTNCYSNGHGHTHMTNLHLGASGQISGMAEKVVTFCTDVGYIVTNRIAYHPLWQIPTKVALLFSYDLFSVFCPAPKISGVAQTRDIKFCTVIALVKYQAHQL